MSVKIREKTLLDGSKSLYLDIYQNGKRTYDFLDIYIFPKDPEKKEKMKIAEGIRAKREIEIISNESGFIPAFKKKANFIDYIRNHVKEITTSSKQNWISMHKHLNEYTGGVLMFKDVTPEWIDGFQKYLLTKVSNNTASYYFSMVITIIRKAIKANLFKTNPAIQVQPIRVKKTTREYLSIEELSQLNDTPCPNNIVKLAFLFSCYTGLRISDIRKLKWENIADSKMIIVQKKTDTPNDIPLNQIALDILKKIRGERIQTIDNRIFNLPSSNGNVWLYIKAWAKQSGLKKKISFHTSRHTFATLTLNSGTDLYTVSKLLGHTNINTTQVYAKIVDKTKEEAVSRLPTIKIV